MNDSGNGMVGVSGAPTSISREVLSNLTVAEIKAELRSRNIVFNSKRRKTDLLTLLKTSLHLPVTHDAQLRNGKATKWNKKHPGWILLYGELKAGNIPLDIAEMGPAEVYCKYTETLELQMDDMAFGDTFCQRLEKVRQLVRKEIPMHRWDQEHPARNLLFDEIKKGNIPLDENDMGPAEVFCHYHETFEFRLRGMEFGDTFVRRLRALREQIKGDRDRAEEDLSFLKTSMHNHPVPLLTHKGKFQWNRSIAHCLLKHDMEQGLHKRMTPAALWETRNGLYKLFLDLKDFRDKIYTITRMKKYLYTLEHNAEQKLRKHLGT